jgi:myo-inositol-1(or 4)-monophosphatase
VVRESISERTGEAMNANEALFQDLVGEVVRLGEEARGAQGRVERGFKEDGTTVTEMDRKVESSLREFLHQRFPADRVLGEEGGSSGPVDGANVWIIDPIDGTTNYGNGLPIWAVSVGRMEQGGIPEWGCIFAPALGDLYVARQGRGALRNGQPLVVPPSRRRMGKEDILGITSEGVKDWEFQVPGKIRAMGSAALQAVLVAGGHYVGYFLETWRIWDIAAALLIAREAGVQVTRRSGEAFVGFPEISRKKGEPLLFALPGVHQELLSLISPREA